MKRIILVVLYIIPAFSCFAQENECKTKVRRQYPPILKEVGLQDNGQVWNVPVIFHVLYNTPEQNIADSLIMGVLKTLNEDFLAINPDLRTVPAEFDTLRGTPDINFVLATKLPDDTPTTGIIRTRTSTRMFKYKQRKMFTQSKIVDSKRYLNVYICSVNTNGFTPSKTNSKYDGVVMNYKRAFPGIRTLTHEVGHWFDLRHIFHGNCDNKDSVEDTPPQKKHSHYCPKYPNKDCGQSTMFMNFMDYSSCRCFFTTGQVKRMRNYIINYKKFNS